MYAALLLSMFSAPAFADTQPFVLESAVEIFPAKDIDSGWWPEEGPVRVRAEISAEGLAGVDITGESTVSQGGGGTAHSLDNDSAAGVVSVLLDMSARLHLSLDVVGYEWEGMLHEEAVEFDVSESFRSFAFAEDGGAELGFLMDTKDVFAIEQGILPLVNVVATGSLTPTADLVVVTDAIETGEGLFTAAGQSVSTSGGTLVLDASGSVESALYLMLRGHAEVCITWVDCYGDFNYDFDLDPIESTQSLVYDTVTVSHAGGPAGDGLPRSSADEEAKAGGGCSTVPGAGPGSAVLMMLAVLVATRRRA